MPVAILKEIKNLLENNPDINTITSKIFECTLEELKILDTINLYEMKIHNLDIIHIDRCITVRSRILLKEKVIELNLCAGRSALIDAALKPKEATHKWHKYGTAYYESREILEFLEEISSLSKREIEDRYPTLSERVVKLLESKMIPYGEIKYTKTSMVIGKRHLKSIIKTTHTNNKEYAFQYQASMTLKEVSCLPALDWLEYHLESI
jgi:hypothetical protein